MDALRKFGYSLCGYQARSIKLLSMGKRSLAMGLMTTTVLLDCYVTVVDGTVDGDVFYHFVQSSLYTSTHAIQWYQPQFGGSYRPFITCQ